MSPGNPPDRRWCWPCGAGWRRCRLALAWRESELAAGNLQAVRAMAHAYAHAASRSPGKNRVLESSPRRASRVQRGSAERLAHQILLQC